LGNGDDKGIRRNASNSEEPYHTQVSLNYRTNDESVLTALQGGLYFFRPFLKFLAGFILEIVSCSHNAALVISCHILEIRKALPLALYAEVEAGKEESKKSKHRHRPEKFKGKRLK